jgi:hypothetical protein
MVLLVINIHIRLPAYVVRIRPENIYVKTNILRPAKRIPVGTIGGVTAAPRLDTAVFEALIKELLNQAKK